MCVPLLCNVAKYLQNIYVLPKQLAKIVSNVHYCQYTNGLFCELHILKLSDFVNLKTAIIMYDANKKLLPNYMLLLVNSL